MAGVLETLNKNRFAAKAARGLAAVSLLNTGSLQIPEALQTQAEERESKASPESQFASQRQRARHSTVDLDSIRPDVYGSQTYNPTEEDSAAQDDYVSNWLASQQANVDGAGLDGYNPAINQSRIRSAAEDFARQQASSLNDKIGQEIFDMCYASVAGGAGIADTPCEDGGIVLGSAAVTSGFQLARTFSGLAEDSVSKTGLAKALPPAFNTNSIIGWFQIVNAVFVLLWATGPGLLVLLFAFIVLAAATGITGTAVYTASKLFMSVFGS